MREGQFSTQVQLTKNEALGLLATLDLARDFFTDIDEFDFAFQLQDYGVLLAERLTTEP